MFCGVICLIELRRYQTQIKNQFSDLSSVDLTWLRSLVVGFLLIRLIAVFVTLGFIFTIVFGITINYGFLGLFSNWIVLFLISFSSIASANCAGPNVYPSLPESERQALEAKAADVPFPEGLLWRAEKGGVVSHLIGTFHVHLPEHAAMVTRLEELTPQPETLEDLMQGRGG